MADEILRSKHAFGSRSKLNAAIESGVVDAYDILFLNGENETPAVGWVDKDGNPIVVEGTDLGPLENQIDELENELSRKVDANEVDAKIGEASRETVTTAKSYTDQQIEAILSSFTIVEF